MPFNLKQFPILYLFFVRHHFINVPVDTYQLATEKVCFWSHQPQSEHSCQLNIVLCKHFEAWIQHLRIDNTRYYGECSNVGIL